MTVMALKYVIIRLSCPLFICRIIQKNIKKPEAFCKLFFYYLCNNKASKMKSLIKKLRLKLLYMLNLKKTDGNTVIKEYLEKEK
jgi:hypothetical protein